jgi:tetratricopeptide (TPR) repeat protein
MTVHPARLPVGAACGGTRRGAGILLLGVTLVMAGERGIAEDTSWMELDAQAVALYQAGRYAEASDMTEDALRRAVQAFGPDHVDVAKYQHNLARLYALQHREAEAELLYRRSLTIVERAQGATHPQVASILEGYAALKRAMGNAAEAASLEARLKKVRAADPARMQRWRELSAHVEALSQQGRYAEAAKVAREALTVAEEVFGPSDPSLARSLSDLAELYRVAGQLAQAEPLQLRALAIREKALGPRHPHVAQSLSALGHLYKAQGRYGKAQASYERALSINEAALGSEDFTVANDLNNLAELAVAQGNFGSAAGLYRRLLDILERTADLASGELAMTWEKYAHCLRQLGKTREAEQIEAKARALSAPPTSGTQP